MAYVENERTGKLRYIAKFRKCSYHLIDGQREINFLYVLKKGLAEHSFGIECGRLAGLPSRILDIAVRQSNEAGILEQKRVKARR